MLHVEPGDRVAYTGRGTYATHYTGPAAGVVPLPAGISDEEAAAILLKGMTAWMLLEEIRPLQKGETALVWAPVGGVGSLRTMWSKVRARGPSVGYGKSPVSAWYSTTPTA